MADVVDIKPASEIDERSRVFGKRIADVLVTSMTMVADAKTADMSAEIEAIKSRLDRLERAYPREVEGDE
jgi:hypothetical protein